MGSTRPKTENQWLTNKSAQLVSALTFDKHKYNRPSKGVNSVVVHIPPF